MPLCADQFQLAEFGGVSEAVSDWAILAVHLGPPLSLLSRISERSAQTGPQMRVGTEDRAQLDVILTDHNAHTAAARPIRGALQLLLDFEHYTPMLWHAMEM